MKKKPFKGYRKGINSPSGGLSRKHAKKLGIHAGVDMQAAIRRAGGVSGLSDEMKARRERFCSRMCGAKKRNTSSKTANDPDSKINAALRVWRCRCSGGA
jgi:hypothetical protein